MSISAQGAEHLAMKIGRAYKHIMEFDSLVVAHCKRTDWYTATAYDDMSTSRYIVRCMFAPIPGDIPLSLGDFVYNLRSGLDQLAWQLSLLKNPDPGRKTMFPIYGQQTPNNKRLFSECVRDMSDEAILVIEDLQPYKRGAAYRDDPLWQLNELSNMDKHRLPAGRSTDTSLYVEPHGHTRRDFDNGVELSWPLQEKSRVKIEVRTPTLIFGDPIDSTGSRDPIEVSREDIAEIYRYVREEVAPRFAHFFL